MLFSFEFSISHFHHAHLVAILYALKQRYEQSTLFWATSHTLKCPSHKKSTPNFLFLAAKEETQESLCMLWIWGYSGSALFLMSGYPQQMENPNVSLLHDKMWLIYLSNAQRLDNPVLRHVTVSPTVVCFAKIKISWQIGRSLKAPPSQKVTLNSFYLSAVKGWWGYCRHPARWAGRWREYTSL